MLSSDSIHDHLFVRAIVVENGTTCAALVGMDIGSADDAIIKDALSRAVESSKCPEENFALDIQIMEGGILHTS